MDWNTNEIDGETLLEFAEKVEEYDKFEERDGTKDKRRAIGAIVSDKLQLN